MPLKKLIDWVKSKHIVLPDNEVITPHKTTQQDTRDEQAKKRFNKQFDAEAEQIQAMSFKPHDSSCMDTRACTKNPCYIWEPDKIVGEAYEVMWCNKENKYIRK